MTTYHTTGTISVIGDDTLVTGTGTDWATALITAGVIYIEGAAYPLASVESNTSLTLVLPYAGPTASGLAYAIDRASVVAEQTVTNANRLAQLLEILPTFSDFAETLFNDTDATSAKSTLEIPTISAFAETLLDDANAAAMLTTLGIPYEVGSFTPQFTFSTPGTVAPIYTTQIGSYVKIGKLAIISINLRFDTNTYTGAAGTARISNLPFTVNGWGSVTFSRVGKVMYGTASVGGEITNTTNYVTPWANQSGSDPTFLSTAAFPPATTGFTLVASSAYQIA